MIQSAVSLAEDTTLPEVRIENTAFAAFLNATVATENADNVLDGDYLVYPPDPDYGYWATPANSVTFLTMGVDGVHTVILTMEGQVRANSPVVYVMPMYSDAPQAILAGDFVDYLAEGCAVSRKKMEGLLELSSSEPETLIGFLADNFKRSRLLEDNRIVELNKKFLHLSKPKPEDAFLFPENEE